MSDSYTLNELAKITESELKGDPDFRISFIESLELAGPSDAAFVDNQRYVRKILSSKAGVILIHPDLYTGDDSRSYLLNEMPSFAFQKIIELFLKPICTGFNSIHPNSTIHETAELGENIQVGPHASIDRDAKIGANTIIGPCCSIGAEVSIGANCILFANSVVREGCILKEGVILQPGAVIGSCGFGYITDKKGKHHKLPHLGNVILEEDVEVGANTTIDRARFKTTIVRRGVKIDNLVQIAHQVDIGEGSIIVSQVGIAGSTKIGKLVVMGGQSGVAGHIEITDQVVLAARTAVSKSLKEKGVYYGAPAMIDKEFKEYFMALRGVPRLIKRVKELEEAVKTIPVPPQALGSRLLESPEID
ncbi:MAG: UDP-3-O-(3-hydroxymyristoyl)glucosamine N-acyltransferase [Chlamydiales bacterium]